MPDTNPSERYRTVTRLPFPILIYAQDGQVLHINTAWTTNFGSPIEATDSALASDDASPLESYLGALYQGAAPVEAGRYIMHTTQIGETIWEISTIVLDESPESGAVVLR